MRPSGSTKELVTIPSVAKAKFLARFIHQPRLRLAMPFVSSPGVTPDLLEAKAIRAIRDRR
ncbi:MAG TPA: hypothetical protein VGA27_01785, partial [Candidatus Binatia bacterium]